MDQGYKNPVGHGRESRPKNFGCSDCFCHQSQQLVENSALSVGLIKDLASPNDPFDDSRFRQPLQFSLDSTLTGSGSAYHLTQVKRLIWMTEEQSQNGATGFPEKRC